MTLQDLYCPQQIHIHAPHHQAGVETGLRQNSITREDGPCLSKLGDLTAAWRTLSSLLRMCCELVLWSVPLWLFKRTVIFRIDICSFQGLLFPLFFLFASITPVFVKSPSLILLVDHSHFQGCSFHSVFYFPLPCFVYLFWVLFIIVFLFFAFHFPSVFCHYTIHFSGQLVTTLFPISKTIAFNFVCVSLFPYFILFYCYPLPPLPHFPPLWICP